LVKDIYQVLRDKELAVARVRLELAALRFCLPLLTDANEANGASAAVEPSVAPSNRWPIEVEKSAAASPNPFHN